jgi:HlyD family secretion protein
MGTSTPDAATEATQAAPGPPKEAVKEWAPASAHIAAIIVGVVATWQAERAVGDHDRNTLRLLLNSQGDAVAFEPGMTVCLNR